MEKSVVLPDHVIEEILLRLPVKHLLSWKCVSKRWHALIWDDEFVKKHYRFQYAMHLAAQGDVPILLKNWYPEEPPEFHLLTKQGSCDVVVNITPDFERDVNITKQGSYEDLVCIGVVNGIVGLEWGPGRLTLWNPASREFKDVPRMPFTHDNKDYELFHDTDVISLGFDLHSNDFKILRLIHNNWRHTKTDCIYEFHLYSLKADSWKIIKDTPGTYPELKNPITDAYFNNGVHYWSACDWGDYSNSGIVAFNFSSEIFKEFEKPQVKESWYQCDFSIGKYKEGLALLVNRWLESKEYCIEIWAAIRFQDDDYEFPSSWELVVKTSPIREVESGVFWVGTVFNWGCIILSSGHIDNDACWAYVYNRSMCTVNYLGIKIGRGFRYVESLVPLSRRLNHIDMTS